MVAFNYNLSTGECKTRRILGTCCSARLAELVSSNFREETLSQKQCRKKLRKISGTDLSLHIHEHKCYPHTHAHTCTFVNTRDSVRTVPPFSEKDPSLSIFAPQTSLTWWKPAENIKWGNFLQI